MELFRNKVSGSSNSCFHKLIIAVPFMLFLVSCSQGSEFSLIAKDTGAAPVAGTEIRITDVKDTSLTVSWGTAQDSETTESDLEYKLVMANTADEINSIEGASSAGKVPMNWTESILTFTVTSLAANTKYVFAVMVRDSEGNIAFYTPRETMTTDILPDTDAPTAGNGGTIVADSVSANSMVLYWESASDAKTSKEELSYAVFYSKSNNISTVSSCEVNGVMAAGYKANILQSTITGLDPVTVYYFTVVVKDKAGNKTVYSTKMQATNDLNDIQSPTQGDNGRITVTGNVSPDYIALQWAVGTDNLTSQNSLIYAVYMSESDNISTLPSCKANGIVLSEYTENVTSFEATGLSQDKDYYFNIIVMDLEGNETCYAGLKQRTISGTPGLVYALINGDSEYSVTGGVNITDETVIVPKYHSGKKVTLILDYAFEDCVSMKSVQLPDSISTIGEGVFYGCEGLVNVYLPNSITSIGDYAFESCISLTGITLPESITSIGVGAFDSCCALIAITIPENVAEIRYGTFYNCESLQSINLPNGLTAIGVCAFQGCSSLSEISIPETVASIGQQAFQECINLNSIDLPEGITIIPSWMFGYCYSLTGVTIPNGVTSIGEYAFFNCNSLTEMTIPSNVKTIGPDAFNLCSALTSITISDSVNSIGSNAFAQCSSLTSVELPDSITSIPSGIFLYCTSLTNISIPDTVTSIGYGSFEGCSSLTEITIPASVAAIEAAPNIPFYGCVSLVNVTVLRETPPSIGYGIFDTCSSLNAIHVPAGSVNAYKAAPGWSGYSLKIVSP